MFRYRSTLLATAAILFAGSTAFAEPNVVVSIKPLHSLVAGVMDRVATPGVIVEEAASPHTHSLRPSKARDLERADLIVWAGPQLEAFLAKPITNIGAGASIVELGEVVDLIRLPVREGATFDTHAHDDDSHHEEHAEHEEHEEHEEVHADHHDDAHGEGSFDTHFWLDPANARVVVAEVAQALTKADPDNASKYVENAARVTARIDALQAEVEELIEPVKDSSFIVFHDAYQYFENRFGMQAAGSVTVSPEVTPGAERIATIRDKVEELDVACVFSEPQFSAGLVTVVTEQTNANAAILDPLGADIDQGPELYFTLMRNLAGSMRDCLSESS